jgi:hypothetical protein
VQDSGIVRGLERVDDRVEHLGDLLRQDPLVSVLDRVKVILQIRAAQELHHQTELTAVAATDVQDLHRRGSFQRAQRSLLPDEPLGNLRIARCLGRQDFERDLSAAPAIERAVDDPLSAAAQDLARFVSLVDLATGSITRASHGG